ncbi:MAG: helicase-related protein [Promethearchaeota archaeon]
MYTKERFHSKAYIFEKKPSISITQPSIMGIVGSSNLSLSGLRSNTELNAVVYTNDAIALKKWFMERWNEAKEFSQDLFEIIDNSWVSYLPGTERFPDPYYVYIKAIYEMYKKSLETTEEVLRSFIIYQDLYDFQKWAVLRAIEVARKYNGVIISDVVGLGKSYIGAACLEHFYRRNEILGRRGKVLIICPPKLKEMWKGIINKYSLNARILSLGMLSKENYDETLLNEFENTISVLIDESHHFRNKNTLRYENISKFLPIVNEVILLSATPYSKGARDIYHQIKLFHLEDLTKIPITPPNLLEFIRKVENNNATLTELLTHIMVRRTRYDILNQYGEMDENGELYIKVNGEKKYFPKRILKTIEYYIEQIYGSGFYSEIVDTLKNLTYSRYSLGNYLIQKYASEPKYSNLSTIGNNLRGLMKTLLLKRLESSIYSFRETLARMLNSYKQFLGLVNEGKIVMGKKVDQLLREEEDLEHISEVVNYLLKQEKIEFYDPSVFDINKLKTDLKNDINILEQLFEKIETVYNRIENDYQLDDKLVKLKDLIKNLFEGKFKGINKSIKKILIFSQYSDTIDYIKKSFSWFIENNLLDNSLKLEFVTSKTENIYRVIERFAPKANKMEYSIPKDKEINLLATTDIMSEGVNLQDSNCIINFDIHWNPLKLIQRIGRLDRLDTEHDEIYVFNFLPEKELENDLHIIEKVASRIKEINDVLGMDSQLLKEDEQPNLSYMTSIYQENIDEVEKFERKILIGEDMITDSLNLLKKLINKEPELISKIKKLDGIRSAKEWNENYDAIFILCKAGNYINPYLISLKTQDDIQIQSSIPEFILKCIKSEPDEKAISMDRELFRKNYVRACKKAIEEFKKELKERRKLIIPKRSASRNYILQYLKEYSKEILDNELKNTINHYRKIIQSTNIDSVLKEFKKIESESIRGKQLFLAIESIIQKYNLEEKWENKKKWQETFDEPIHILCGMYLKGKS